MSYFDDEYIMKKSAELDLKYKVGKKLQDMLQECVYDMVSIGIPIQTDRIDEIVHLGKLEGTMGVCGRYTADDGKMAFSITVNKKILKKMENPVVVKNVKNTLYHELLHTCPDCVGHNENWLKYAKICDEKLGTKTRQRLSERIYLGRHKGTAHHFCCDNCGFKYITEEFLTVIQCPICKIPIYEQQEIKVATKEDKYTH